MLKRWRNGDYFHITFDNVRNKWTIKKVGTIGVLFFNSKQEAYEKAQSLTRGLMKAYVVAHDKKGKFVAVKE